MDSDREKKSDQAPPPTTLRSLRACLRCKLIKTTEQFKNKGCENCGPNISLDRTTPIFHGMVAMMQPSESWVARWHRLRGQVKGMYAITVVGSLPEEEEEGEEQDEDYE